MCTGNRKYASKHDVIENRTLIPLQELKDSQNYSV